MNLQHFLADLICSSERNFKMEINVTKNFEYSID